MARSRLSLITYIAVAIKSLKSRLTLCNPVDCSRQIPLFMGFSRQEYCSGLPFPSPRDLSKQCIKPASSALQADSKELLSRRGSPATYVATILIPWIISTISSLGLKNYLSVIPSCVLVSSFPIYSPRCSQNYPFKMKVRLDHSHDPNPSMVSH